MSICAVLICWLRALACVCLWVCERAICICLLPSAVSCLHAPILYVWPIDGLYEEVLFFLSLCLPVCPYGICCLSVFLHLPANTRAEKRTHSCLRRPRSHVKGPGIPVVIWSRKEKERGRECERERERETQWERQTERSGKEGRGFAFVWHQHSGGPLDTRVSMSAHSNTHS